MRLICEIQVRNNFKAHGFTAFILFLHPLLFAFFRSRLMSTTAITPSEVGSTTKRIKAFNCQVDVDNSDKHLI